MGGAWYKEEGNLSETKWTNEQLDAITEKGCNLLVAAAAGAGKTAVLVERIIRKITCDENPVDIDKLLIVTFTNAAATEMRERIAEAISRALDKNPDSQLLQRQLALLNKANITTIHSFCLDVIRNNFHYIGLNPGFKISDETEALLLKIEALDDVFEEIYSEEPLKKEFFDLLECYGGNRDDQALKDLVLTLYNFIQSYPWPDEWLREKTSYFNIDYLEHEEINKGFISQGDAVKGYYHDFARTIWGRILIEYISVELMSHREAMGKAISIIESSSGLEPYLKNFQEEKRKIEHLIGVCNIDASNVNEDNDSNRVSVWDNLYDAIRSFTFDRLPRCKKDADKTQQERVKDIRDDVKKQLRALQDKIFISSSKEIIEDLKHVYPLLDHLAELVMAFDSRYSEIKRSRSLLDFNDLEHFCLEILTEKNANGEILPSNAAMEYRERFEEILVDEYQDSNMVQEIILNIISRKEAGQPNIFMVGDVKQSIYRFRQARPELFLEKYNSYSTEKGQKFRKIQLFKNFRSRRSVIDTVNFIFSKIMSEQAGELDYDEKEALNFGAVSYEASDRSSEIENTYNTGGSTELHIIEMENENEDNSSSDADYKNEKHDSSNSILDTEGYYSDENSYNSDDNLKDIYGLFTEEPLDNVRSEARLVAKRINELMDTFGVYDKNLKSYRPIEYRDIVILLRSTRNWSDVFVEELSLQGIPVYADAGSGFFKTTEVQIMLSLLQIIDNPLQDIPLLAVLRAPFAAFTPDEMADIRLVDREATFYEALAKASGIEKYMLVYSSNPDDSDHQDGDTTPTDDTTSANDITPADDNNFLDDNKLLDDKTSAYDNAAIGEKLQKKVAKFLETLEKWRNKALYMSTDELIWYLYTDTGFYSFVGAMPGGEQRQANLRMLFEYAGRFEETSYKGLFNFINFINKLKIGRGDMGSAKILGENENVVRIMSIHKSKGLEFPVVFLSGCGKVFNMQDLNKNIILHQELGFGPDYVDYEKRISYPTLAKQALRYQIKKESLSEEMRILYVALTRAKEKLILTGTVKNASTSMSRWKEYSAINSDKIPSYIVLKGRSFLDWICPALMQNEEYEKNIKIWNKDQFNAQCVKNTNIDDIDDIDDADDNSDDNSEISDIKSADEDNIMKEIERRLSWVYKYKNAVSIPVKVSVTELKRHFINEFSDEYPAYQIYTPSLVKKPAFLEESKGLNSAEIGTVWHFVMQHLDLKYVENAEDIKNQVKEMVEYELLTSQQASYVDINKILSYFRSDIGRRMLKAAKIYREVPFNMQISSETLKILKSSEVSKQEKQDKVNVYRRADNNDESDTILLQGVIDCFFEEDDGLVLLDYKTDYISPNDSIHAVSRIKARYGTQLQYYEMVLEKLMKKKVKEKYIYLFWNGETVKL